MFNIYLWGNVLPQVEKSVNLPPKEVAAELLGI